jgi:hypothetical protein
MKPTKRQCDPLGRSKTRHRYSRYLLSLAIAMTGSVWPIQARSIEAIFDTQQCPDLGSPLVDAPFAQPRPRDMAPVDISHRHDR